MQWNRRTTLQRSVQITIQSNASLMGRGAVCNGVRTGGSWTPQEQEMHINCLELFAAELAAKSFLKHHQGVNVLLQLDNLTAVASINNVGGKRGGDCILSAHIDGQISLAVGSRERCNALSPAHSRYAKHDSRLQVQSGEGQVRLDAVSRSVSEDQPISETPGGRLVRLTVNSSTTHSSSVGGQISGRSSRCFPTGLEPIEGIRQSPMCLVRHGEASSGIPFSWRC